jgi:hypothetical protein
MKFHIGCDMKRAYVYSSRFLTGLHTYADFCDPQHHPPSSCLSPAHLPPPPLTSSPTLVRHRLHPLPSCPLLPHPPCFMTHNQACHISLQPPVPSPHPPRWCATGCSAPLRGMQPAPLLQHVGWAHPRPAPSTAAGWRRTGRMQILG